MKCLKCGHETSKYIKTKINKCARFTFFHIVGTKVEICDYVVDEAGGIHLLDAPDF